jgi:exopolyphosphatase / guanosine-5'-triphosphate,3'-diphosphate pyrophosphatase
MNLLKPDSRSGAADAASLPLRLASVDIGSNAIRLLVGEFDGPRTYRVIAQERLPVRLGHDVFRHGSLAPEMADRAVRGLASFRRQMDALQVSHYRAVATSAVRESWNGEAFVGRVRRATGLELEVITGSEEARLVQIAVRSRIPFAGRLWAAVDVGGGSVEVMVVSEAGVLWSESHAMGTVRLLEEFDGEGGGAERMRHLMADYTATLRLASRQRLHDVTGLIATGGNIEALAKLVGAETGKDGVSLVPVARLGVLAEEMAALPYAERMRRLDLRPDRADVIVPAAFLYERVARLTGVDVVHVPHVGLKEGVLLDLAENVVSHPYHENEQDRATLAGALALGRRFDFDEAHAAQVGRLAVSLFDQLASLHGLGERDRRILLAAAVLHDVGIYISYKRHHKHSLYVLQHSEIADFSPREMLMVANVARYHRKGPPSDDHPDYIRLSENERDRVSMLAALLRLADALDREHLQRVSDVAAAFEGAELLLTVDATGDLALERWALATKADLFRDLFGLDVTLELAGRGAVPRATATANPGANDGG